MLVRGMEDSLGQGEEQGGHKEGAVNSDLPLDLVGGSMLDVDEGLEQMNS